MAQVYYGERAGRARVLKVSLLSSLRSPRFLSLSGYFVKKNFLFPMDSLDLSEFFEKNYAVCEKIAFYDDVEIDVFSQYHYLNNLDDRFKFNEFVKCNYENKK